MGILYLCGFLLGAQVGIAVGAGQVDASMGDFEFFEKIDLDYPGLEDVRAAVEASDLDAAKSELAAYYRNRTGVFHFIDAHDPTRGITDGERRVRNAQALVERTGDYDEAYWTGDVFDWEKAEMRSKPRMYFFEGMGIAAALEDGEGIAEGLVNLIRSFVDQYHSPSEKGSGMWATMNTGIRMRTGWPAAFLCLLGSSAFTDEDVVLFLKSVWDQTDYIARYPSETSNWLTFEMAGLYTSGVVYPEFKDAEEWRRFASETAVEDMDKGWLPDGMTVELSPGYGQFFSNFYVIYDLAEHVGRLDEFNLEGFPAKTETPFESYLKIMAPDRFAPATNDNRPTGVAAILEKALERFPDREDFRWIVTDGREGTEPEFTSEVLPYAGFAAMRSGWERDANMLYFDFGSVGYRHAHQDGLNVMLWAYGRPILFDPGLAGYDHEDPSVNYAIDTFSHNTVLVDNRPQRRPWYDNPHPRRMPYRKVSGFRWDTTDGYDAAAGIYDEAYGMQGASNAYPYLSGSNFSNGWVHPATHYRRIFFLKPDVFVVADTLAPKDGERHDYDLRWHLDTENARIAEGGTAVITGDSGQPNLEVVPLLTQGLDVRATSGQREPEILGWNAGNPSNLSPATTVQHLKSGAETTRFLTLLLPLQPGEASLFRAFDVLDDSRVRIELNDGRRFIVHAPSDPEQDLSVLTE